MKFYNKNLEEISFDEYIKQGPEYRKVDLTETESYTVSTVFLGFSMRDDAKRLWETMATANGENSFYKWDTEEEAINGHKSVVELLS